MWKRLSLKPSKPSSTTADRVVDTRNGGGKADPGASTVQPQIANENGGTTHESPGAAIPTKEEGLTNNDIALNDVMESTNVPTEDVPAPRSSAENNVLDVPPAANVSESATRNGSTPILQYRLSFRSLGFFYGRDTEETIPFSASAVSLVSQTSKNSKIKSKVRPPKEKLTKSQKEARVAAVALRTLILGPAANPEPTTLTPRGKAKLKASTKATSLASAEKFKSQLYKPKTALAIISHLRTLPLPNGPSFHNGRTASAESLVTHTDLGGAPIHAVCLSCTDEEADQIHFSKLRTGHDVGPYTSLTPSGVSTLATVGTASLESLISVLKDLNVVSLLESPDLGFGQAVTDDSGPLSGSVPSAGTVLDGIEQITKQLMALGFATSNAVLPDHEGIYPPVDRVSVLTYWWGWELVMPEASVKHLAKAKSISNTLINILSALAMFNEGVREILPFVRYISNFVDTEWSMIQAQDQGQGVVCAATWIVPVALVPRAWDFKPKPPVKTNPAATTQPATSAQPNQPSSMPEVDPAAGVGPQLLLTSPTLPRGFNRQQVISV
ncbi:hypothetical protein M422DRAFT_32533 [Sphaerobolus stellatus SS14]|uniref:Uncharacterized protein n=1 Tax=Sphaerobolus stellatus (strain SS14) TaxID=990650 RepID=A0A0C9VF01_SPHS4|nr:hypothetical protein M422DRAFT_32533 [Sphaerobolus stellatus SS14]